MINVNDNTIHTRSININAFALQILEEDNNDVVYLPYENSEQMISDFETFMIDKCDYFENCTIRHIAITPFGMHISLSSLKTLKIFSQELAQNIETQDSISQILFICTKQREIREPVAPVIPTTNVTGRCTGVLRKMHMCQRFIDFLVHILQTTDMPIQDELWYTDDHDAIEISHVGITKCIYNYIAHLQLYKMINGLPDKKEIEPDEAIRKLFQMNIGDGLRFNNFQTYVGEVMDLCTYV